MWDNINQTNIYKTEVSELQKREKNGQIFFEEIMAETSQI